MSEKDFSKYFDSIECYFALKRDAVLLLSPEEFEIVEECYKSNVDLKLVLKAIDIFFEKKKKRKRKFSRPYFLTHVKSEIDAVVADYAKKGVGSYYATGPSETEFIESRIKEIINLLENNTDVPRDIVDTTVKELTFIFEKAKEKTMEEVEKELEKISLFAREKIFDILNVDTKNEIDKEIEELSEKAGKKVPKEVIDRFKMELVFAKFNFPIISLFA